MKKSEGVNFDYIIAIRDDNGQLSIDKIEIDRHDDLIDRLIEMLEDAHCNVVDMHSYTKQILKYYGQVFPFCLGHNYYDSYIEEISFPEIDERAYLKFIYDTEVRIKNVLRLGNIDYANKLENKFSVDIYQSKKRYLEQILPYIYSYDYNETLKSNNINESYKIFSSEIHGRFAYETTVNEDLKIILKTNFCYGGSSYFHIIVRYKGIELLPFSEWVKYYYAGYNSLMRFTRSYYCTRESWTYAIEFVVKYVNKAITDTNSFVKEEVMSEVKALLAGLEDIFTLDEAEFRAKLDVNHIDEDDQRYIGISSARHANDREREYYKIMPSECSMIYRMEKISGALYFLKNLYQLTEIYDDVKIVINRIIELNRLIYPEIKDAIPPIKIEIINLQKELRSIERDYDFKNKRLDYYRSRLKNILQESECSNKKEVENEFKENNPQMNILEIQVGELWKRINQYDNLIDNREKVLQRLKTFKELIEQNIVF